MSSFDNELNICLDLLESRINSTTDEKITPDVALILLNIWLADKKDLINSLKFAIEFLKILRGFKLDNERQDSLPFEITIAFSIYLFNQFLRF